MRRRHRLRGEALEAEEAAAVRFRRRVLRVNEEFHRLPSG